MVLHSVLQLTGRTPANGITIVFSELVGEGATVRKDRDM